MPANLRSIANRMIFHVILASLSSGQPLVAQAGEGTDPLLEQARGLFQALPVDMSTPELPVTPVRVTLGRRLFFDPRLSADGTVSCATCHRPALYATDALPRGIGVGHQVNVRHVPTILNAALQFKAHWLGDRESVEDQATKSLTGKLSFGNPDNETVVKKLKSLGYAEEFEEAFPGEQEPIKPENWGKAIGAYERTLVTPAPFDAYLKGDTAALSAEAKAGLKTFISVGCTGCHSGVLLGGQSFQKFGLFGDYGKEAKSNPVDEGRFTVTGKAEDKYVFKVPLLRNVAMTPPYFHDGSVATLPEAVRIMAKLQLGKDLSAAEVRGIVAFLDSLTGPLPEDYATEPVLTPMAFGPAGPGL